MQKLFIPLLNNGDGKVCASFMESFVNSFGGQNVYLCRIGDSHPGRARNRAAANFLASDCTHLLFLDADIIFNKEDIEAMNASEEPILHGLYPKKIATHLEWCMVPLHENNGQTVSAGTVFPIRRAGTGFLRIAREVFEKLKEYADPYANHGREEWDFFKSGVVKGEWLSEDWYFCDMARSAGFHIMCHSGIQTRHEGVFEYPAAPDRLTWCPPVMRPHIERIWRGEYEVPGGYETILDLGANIGGFSMWASERWPGCRIEAYEPHPDNCAIFKMNLAGTTGVKLRDMAVRAEGGEFTLTEGGNCGEHSFHFDGANTTIAFAVPAASLASAELVKIDTEGCELEILQSLNLSATRAIVLEYHSERDKTSIRELLTSKGYREHQHEEIVGGRGILKFLRK